MSSVALTMKYGSVLHTADPDLARFLGLRWKDALAQREAAARGHQVCYIVPK